MKKLFFVATLCFLLTTSLRCQTELSVSGSMVDDSVSYDLFGESHALMCPFLSPQLISKLKSQGGVHFQRTSDYHLLFKTSRSGFISPSLILDMVERTGYERDKFLITHSPLND